MRKFYLLNIQDKLGQSALHWAAKRGNYDVAELLIFLGADVQLKDNIKRDAEDVGINENNMNIVEIIRMKKNKMNIPFDMWKIREYDRQARFSKAITGNFLNSISDEAYELL